MTDQPAPGIQPPPMREGFVEVPPATPYNGGAQPQAAPPPPPPRAQPQPQPQPAAPTPETPPPIDINQWPVTVKLLHKGVRNMRGESIYELIFREPTGGDINRYGNPVRINVDGDVLIDEKKMTLMMGGLSGIPPPLLEGMDPRDWNSCAYRLRLFFLPDPGAW